MDAANGCCTAPPTPPTIKNATSEINPSTIPRHMKLMAVTRVPTASKTRSPKRSPRKPAGIWKKPVAPSKQVYSKPTEVRERPNEVCHSGKNTANPSAMPSWKTWNAHPVIRIIFLWYLIAGASFISIQRWATVYKLSQEIFFLVLNLLNISLFLYKMYYL